MNALFNSYNKKKNYSSTDWTGISSPGDSNGQEQSWMKGDQDYQDGMGTRKKVSYRNAAGDAAMAIGAFAKSMDKTHFGDFRDDTYNLSEGIMNVVGNFGAIGGIINGAYNVINTVAKSVRAKAEKTDPWGTLQTPGKANTAAWIGGMLDPIQAYSTRKALGYWGVNRRKYAEKLQGKLYEDYNAKQQPFLQARNLELEGIAANYQNNQEPKGPGDYYKYGGQMYGKGGHLSKQVPISSSTTTPIQWPAATTEYLEPNTPGIQIKPIANTLVQTLGDQYLGGKALNMYNTYSDFLKKKSLGTATNVALEHVKLSTPVLGDLATNYIQEGVSSYDAPEVKFGLPGNAQQGPPLYQKAVKAKPHYDVPKNSSTYVKKPLIREKGGTLSGNFLANQKTVGGSMQPMSKDTTVAVGPSHAQGGIGLPNQGAEVEGGETTAGDYVFSKELGFAKLHMPIAKAKGKVENKPATRERLNTLKLLNKKENDLKLFQEYTKKQLNIQ